MKLTSIMRWNSAASERPNGADSAAPALAIRMSIGCRAAASAIGRFDRSLIGDIGDGRELRRAGCYGFIQRGAVAAEHRDRRARFRQRRRDRTADAPPAAGDERMGGTRQSGHRSGLQDEGSAYILNFKLLQGSESVAASSRVARMSGAISGAVLERSRMSFRSSGLRSYEAGPISQDGWSEAEPHASR